MAAESVHALPAGDVPDLCARCIIAKSTRLRTSFPTVYYLRNECLYDDSPPPNRRWHEGENEEYLPLQAAKMKIKMRDRLEFTERSP